MKRRKAKIVYKEAEAKIRNKVQEIRNPKYLPGPGLCYGVAVFKAERSKIINIEEVDNTSAPVVENPPDTVDKIESGEVHEPEMTESPSNKTKIDMKKKSESNKKSESFAYSDLQRIRRVRNTYHVCYLSFNGFFWTKCKYTWKHQK